MGIVTGWGWTNEEFNLGEKPDTLQTVDVPVWNNEECQMSYKNMMKSNQISDSQMCAGGRNGGVDCKTKIFSTKSIKLLLKFFIYSACWSDSGGPLISKSTGNLIGIVSTGVGCARKGLPGIYTRVSKYAKWIEKIVRA